MTSDPVAIKRQFMAGAGFYLRLHRRDACATESEFLIFSTRLFFKLVDLTME
jgi:hypothetical protein